MLTATKIKENWNQVLDELITKKTLVEFEHKGMRFQIAQIGSANKLDRLVPRPQTIVGDTEDLVHVDWSGECHLDLP